MNVLLIGGTGVLSSAVTAEARKCGMNVTMINRGRRKIPAGVECIVSDNTQYESIKQRLNGRSFDAVIDFLCYTESDLVNSFNLYSKFTKQYFFISSCAVYDTSEPGLYGEEAPKVSPKWNYSVNKWACEKTLATLSENSPCNYTIVRPCLTYGDTRLPYGIGPEFRMQWTLVARILAGKPIIRWNRGENRWNMMRVEDFAVGLVGLIGNPRAFGEAYNICGDEMPSNNDVIHAIETVIGKTAQVFDVDNEYYARHLPPGLANELLGGRCSNLTCSNAKIKNAVPTFAQHISLKDGVAKTIAAYRENNFQLGIDWYYDALCDLVIANWCRDRSLPVPRGLGYVDYLGKRSLADRALYIRYRHPNSFCYRVFGCLLRIVGRVI